MKKTLTLGVLMAATATAAFATDPTDGTSGAIQNMEWHAMVDSTTFGDTYAVGETRAGEGFHRVESLRSSETDSIAALQHLDNGCPQPCDATVVQLLGYARDMSLTTLYSIVEGNEGAALKQGTFSKSVAEVRALVGSGM